MKDAAILFLLWRLLMGACTFYWFEKLRRGTGNSDRFAWERSLYDVYAKISFQIEKRLLICASPICENPWNDYSFETLIALWIFVFKKCAFLFLTSLTVRSERCWLPGCYLKVSCLLPGELMWILLLLPAAQIPAWQRMPWRFTLFFSCSAIKLVAPRLSTSLFL
jgi:hypothetical protein